MQPGENQPPEEPVFFDRAGGHDTFARMIRTFFAGVRDDPVLLPMYAHDLEGSEQRLLAFMEQYWGGPDTYSRTRGAPMLRMRHMSFKVTPTAREHWVGRMGAAIATLGLDSADEALLHDYVERAATYLVNADD